MTLKSKMPFIALLLMLFNSGCNHGNGTNYVTNSPVISRPPCIPDFISKTTMTFEGDSFAYFFYPIELVSHSNSEFSQSIKFRVGTETGNECKEKIYDVIIGEINQDSLLKYKMALFPGDVVLLMINNTDSVIIGLSRADLESQINEINHWEEKKNFLPIFNFSKERPLKVVSEGELPIRFRNQNPKGKYLIDLYLKEWDTFYFNWVGRGIPENDSLMFINMYDSTIYCTNGNLTIAK